jgi:SAM-dependent methyltransferase
VALAGLSAGDRVVEVGCGPGTATVGLAERGLEVVCVELGAGLAALARRNLAGFPRVRVVEAAFESWQPDGAPFAAVVAFSAFHWVDPEVGYAKAASVLRPEGPLGLAGSLHVLPADGDPFFAEVQADYEATFPGEDNRPPPDPGEVADLSAQMEASGHFRFVAHRRYLVERWYTAAEYVDLLETFSGHRALDPERRRDLLARIRRRIESRPGGRVRKSTLMLLNVARRL